MDNMSFLICKQAFLYTAWKINIIKRVGWVYLQDTNVNRTKFITTDKECYTCSSKPKEIYNNSVWFFKENDDLAAKLFAEKEKEDIEICKKKLQRHEERLKKFLERRD